MASARSISSCSMTLSSRFCSQVIRCYHIWWQSATPTWTNRTPPHQTARNETFSHGRPKVVCHAQRRQLSESIFVGG